MVRGVALLLLALWLPPSSGADVPLYFEDPVLQARYTKLIGELRCLVCQNQSLADSPAPLADDMRHEVYRLIQQAYSDEQIVAHLASSFGDFVHYRPPLRGVTLLLWFGPLLLFVIAVWIIVHAVRGQVPEDD